MSKTSNSLTTNRLQLKSNASSGKFLKCVSNSGKTQWQDANIVVEESGGDEIAVESSFLVSNSSFFNVNSLGGSIFKQGLGSVQRQGYIKLGNQTSFWFLLLIRNPILGLNEFEVIPLNLTLPTTPFPIICSVERVGYIYTIANAYVTGSGTVYIQFNCEASGVGEQRISVRISGKFSE